MLRSGGPIRLGDLTSGGGRVITASGTNFIIDDLPLVLQGDKATCEKHGGIQTFVEHCLGNMDEDKGWVIEGCKLSCGCIAYSSCASTFWVEDTIGCGYPASELAQMSPWLSMPADADSIAYDQQFQLVDEHGQPVPNTKYKIVSATGKLKSGITDAEGKTMRVFATAAEDLHVHWVGSNG
jgi:uncharacterized Zn-binding protein involved in type VI secretion